jgi:hypothetical protein
MIRIPNKVEYQLGRWDLSNFSAIREMPRVVEEMDATSNARKNPM